MSELRSGRQPGVWTAVGLFALTLLSRIPFRSQILYHWDSVNFAYAMREFSVVKEQPQPPGYIVYVWLCRLVDLLFGDAQTTMVWISVVAGALAVVALFYLGRATFDARTGLIAALFLATSPLFWFYGEIALPHSLDTLLVIVGVWWLYETMQGRHRYLYPAIAAMAVAGGVRQQNLLFLIPLILFALRKVDWKRFLVAGALGAAICLAWFVPLMASSGGVSAYLETVAAYTERFNATTSVFMGGGWWGVRRNLLKLSMYTLFGWSAALLPFAVYVVAGARRKEWPGNWEKALFFALWLAPTLIFYTLVHMGQQGLVFVFLPAFLLWGAAGLVRLFAVGPGRRLAVAAAALLAVNVALFCLAPEHPLGSDRFRLLTRATLVNSDRYYRDRFEVIEASFAPESTAILAASSHHVEYYLPDYVLLPFSVGSKWEIDEGRPKGSFREVSATPIELGLRLNGRGQAEVVIFDPDLMAFSKSSVSVQELPLQHGGNLDYFVLAGEQTFHYDSNSFRVGEN
jgi:hypothetical protein